MIKSILISIQPQHLVNILNRKKILELRKTIPKNYKGWVYIYCSKNGDNLVHSGKSYQLEKGKKLDYDLNGKVVARFWFDDYIKLDYEDTYSDEFYWRNSIISGKELEKATCLSQYDIVDYGKNKPLYAWHIKQLEIFDEPLELSEFYRKERKDDIEVDVVSSDGNFVRLSRPPQSWQYIFSNETGEEHV